MPLANILFVKCGEPYIELTADPLVTPKGEKVTLTAKVFPKEQGVSIDLWEGPTKLEPGPDPTDGDGIATLERVAPNAGKFLYKAIRAGYEGSNVVEISRVEVTFDPDPVRTGYSIPDALMQIRTDVTATVVPADVAADITLHITGLQRVQMVGAPTLDAQAGTIEFVVRGMSATPANKPNGDASIEARINGQACGDVGTVVVIPRRIHQPYPQASGNVTPQNLVLDATTSPAYWGPLPAGSVKLTTQWLHWLTVTVQDQFGDVLDDLYAGAPVAEYVSRTGYRSINQMLTANGTYQDPVGLWSSPVPPNDVVAANSAAAQNWPTANPLPMQPSRVPQSIPVRVGGHRLAELIRRNVIGTPPNHVEVKWPP